MNKTNTTTATALTVIRRPATPAERERAILFDAISTTERLLQENPCRRINWPQAATLTEFAGLYTLNMGKLFAYLAIRAQDAASALPIIGQLVNDLRHEQTAADTVALWRQVERLEAEAEALREHAAAMHTVAVEYGKISRRVSSSAAEKADALEQRSQAEAAEKKALREAQRKLQQAADIERRLQDITATAAADAVQAGALAYWETVSFTAGCSAAGQEIRNLKKEQGHGSSRTKVKRLTGKALEDARAQAAAYQVVAAYETQQDGTKKPIMQPLDEVQIPFKVRGSNGTTTGYWTLEHRNSKRYPDGDYKVNHYKTAGRLSLDAFGLDAADTDTDEQTEADNLSKHTMYYQTMPNHDPIFADAKLNERQRTVIALAVNEESPRIAAAGIAAAHAHMADADKRAKAASNTRAAKAIRRRAAASLETVRIKAQFTAAAKAIGISDNQLRNGKFVKGIKDKLEEAKQRTKATEAAEIPTTSAHVDRLGWCFAHGPMTAEPQYITINWIDDYPQPVTITAEERAAQAQAEAEARAAEAEAKRPYMLFADYRRRLYQDRPQGSAYAALDAQAAARVYWEAMTKAEQWQLVCEAYAAEAAAAQATADRLTAAAMDKRSKAAQEAEAFWMKEAKRSTADAKRAAAQAKAARADVKAARSAKKAAQTENERTKAQKAIDRAKAAESAAKAAQSAAKADTAACKARAAEAVQRAAEVAQRDTATIRTKAAQLAADAAAIAAAAPKA